MSRAASTTHKATSSSSARLRSTASASATASCTVRNGKSGSVNACLEEVLYLPYYHDISAWTPHVFVALYAMATFVHVVQAVLSKRWFLLSTFVVAGICETIGWAGRWWSVSTTVWQPARGGYWQSETIAYIMQAITLIIGPCFLNLGWYLLLTRLIRILGSKFCRFTPTLTGLVLAGSTIVAMSLQGAGAGLQASSRIPVSVSPGSYIILAGLALQILVMLVYLEILIELVWRARKGHPAIPFPRSRAVPNDITTPNSSLEKVERLLIATASSFILVFVRTCYRLVVLVLGRLSPVARNDALFCLLDGAVVLFSLGIYNFLHPLWFLPPEPLEEDKEKAGDESWFDTTPFEDKTMQQSQLTEPATKWKAGKQPTRMIERQSSGSSFEGSDNLEWVTDNQRRTQMNPLYEGSVYSGK